ncbi:efflux RND transporter periplasmic adaptor subunit [Devosia sp. SL43]|uniref:efflux RND transporter periplasmic adaptor subunit n=1 Tax=Devosia sp. SL43 TaxID=2806348 RepID=UPI001F019A30|nr:efflux RND transporter periplasmic adaptor subunit [Devosia sp. SL43]UJW84971.1 efflux RND transporter periplasmic adaptor subunit [Devosia sp. SL43]
MKPYDISSEVSSRRTLSGRMQKWFWPVVLLVSITGLACVLLVNQSPAAPTAASVSAVAAPRTMRLHALDVLTIEPQVIEELVKVTGTINPAREAAISAQVSGLAEVVAVRPGDQVAQGDALIEIGTSDLRLQLDQQRAAMASSVVQLRAAETSLARTRSLADKGLAAQTALDAAQSEVDHLTATIESQQSQVTLAEDNLQRATVQAPFAGTIATRSIEPGQIVSPGATILSLVDLSTVRVEAIASLDDSARLVPGQDVRLAVQGIPGKTFTGTIDRINPLADPGTRSIRVHLTLDNPDGVLRGGMFVTGNIVVQRVEQVIAVPTGAIQARDDARYVLAIADGVLQERRVQTGTQWQGAGLVQTIAGLAAGDMIVARSLTGLAAGSPVVIEGN